MSRKETYTIDMSSPEERAIFLREFSKLRGMQIFTVKAARTPEQSDANARRKAALRRLYWCVYVKAFRLYLAAQGQAFSETYCHALLKSRLLKQDVIDQNTGEVIGEIIGSIADGSDVDADELSAYIANVHEFLAGGLGIDVPELPYQAPQNRQTITASAARPRLLPARVA